MSKIQLPPSKTEKKIQKPISEHKIAQIVNKGGSSILSSDLLSDDFVKNFSVKIPKSDLEMVGVLCKKRPQKFGRKITFAKQDWFLEAVKEKIDRERKKYSV